MNKSLIDQLASSQGRADQQPNLDLAANLASSNNSATVAELAQLVQTGEKPIRHDAIKVLYEIGVIEPSLLRPQIDVLVSLLAGSDNRMLWGALQALDTLVDIEPDKIAQNLNAILDAADRSSVIAKDKTTSILAKLNGNARFVDLISPVLLQRLQHAAPNQFPTYATMAASTISEHYRSELVSIIKLRQTTISSPAKQQKLNKLLRLLSKSAPNLVLE